MLTGPPGSGKSHLAAIFAERSGALTVPVAAVTAAAVPDLAEADALVIEDADRAEGRDEAALFHLLNLARERSLSVVVTASRPVEAWGLATRTCARACGWRPAPISRRPTRPCSRSCW